MRLKNRSDSVLGGDVDGASISGQNAPLAYETGRRLAGQVLPSSDVTQRRTAVDCDWPPTVWTGIALYGQVLLSV